MIGAPRVLFVEVKPPSYLIAEALAGDWARIGADMSKVIEKMAKSPYKQKSNPIGNAVAAQLEDQQVGMVTTQTTQLYQGPIPHTDVLAKFDDLVPGTGERLIKPCH